MSIRSFELKDLNKAMTIWLDTNIKAHHFIHESYWRQNYEMVKEMVPNAEVYVFDENQKIKGFVGIDKGYIAGIFVEEKMQSQGIGKMLLDQCKANYSTLRLKVYEKNKKAAQFYQREGFKVESAIMDEATSENELYMIWSK